MGKNSLDAFERYPLTKLRPAAAAPGRSCYRLLELSWAALEPEAGIVLAPPEVGDGRVLLRLRLDAGRDCGEACGFIRRMGSCYAGGKALAGVVMTAGQFSGTALGELARSYRQGFSSTFLLAEPGTELMERCRREEIQPGLWLPLREGILPLRRRIAQGNLERVWRGRPVYLYAGRELTPEELEAGRRWHSSGADSMACLGARMTLRRLMFPSGLTSGGALPLRMWWQNIGTAPVYHETQARLELRGEQGRFGVFMSGGMGRPGLGDSMLNTTARLPSVPCGTYSLWCGLEAGGRLLPLAMEAEEDNGMYRVGQLTLDAVPRPYLDTLWQTRYADGYYPLEDPAEPE